MSNLWQCRHILLSGKTAKQLVVQGTEWHPNLLVRALSVSVPAWTSARSPRPSGPYLLRPTRRAPLSSILCPLLLRPLSPVCEAPLPPPLVWARDLHTSPSQHAEDREHPPQQQPPQQQPNQRQRLQLAVRDYGATVIVFHVTISLASLGFFYLAVKSGLDVVAMLRWVGLGDSLAQSKIVTGGSTFVLAYAVHKVFAPARIATTLGCTPFIVRYLRRRGLLRTPPPRD